MDARTGSPSPHPTTAAAANPSAGSVGHASASAGAPPSISLARGLFMPSRMTSAAGIVAPTAAPDVMKPSAPPSNLPNAAQPKKGKTSAAKEAEERRVAVEERKVALEERKVGMEERSKLLEWEKHLFFLDTSLFNDAQKENVNLAREQVLIQKRAMIRAWVAVASAAWVTVALAAWVALVSCVAFGATMGGMVSMNGFGATMETMGGMGGFGPLSDGLDGMSGMGGMSFTTLIDGMGAPPGAGVRPSHDLGNTFRVSRDENTVRNNGEEEKSSLAESDELEEDEDEDEA